MSLVADLLEAFATGHPDEAALAFEAAAVDDGAAAALGSLLPGQARIALLTHLPPQAAARLLTGADVERAAEDLGRLSGIAAAPVLRAIPADRRDAILSAAGPASEPFRRLLGYPENTAGALMDPLVPAYREELTVAEAQDRVRRDAARGSYYVYVTDAEGKLQGVLTLRELLLAAPPSRLDAVMRRAPAALPAMASWETVLAHPGWQLAHALPVVDRGRYVGTVRHRTLRALEQQPREPNMRRERQRTTRDLAELYALGWSSLVAWGTDWMEAALRRPDRGERPGEDR